MPQNASAVLIIDEAQNLPHAVLEQIRILSNLETDKEKLLQHHPGGAAEPAVAAPIGRTPSARSKRVSIRYELSPLDADAVGAYVAHRLAIAGGSSVTFSGRALALVHRVSGGIPRLINLICDRALVAGYRRTSRITPEIVRRAAEGLELAPQPKAWFAMPARWTMSPLATAAGVILLASAFAVGATTVVYQWLEGLNR